MIDKRTFNKYIFLIKSKRILIKAREHNKRRDRVRKIQC